MSWTDGATLAAALIALAGVFLAGRTRWRIAQATAERKRVDALATRQEEVTAEQIRADDAEKARLSQDLRWFVDELKDRIETLERQLRDMRADLDQVRHIEGEQRAKVTRLTSENTVLRAQVAEVPELRAKVADLTAENQRLHRRMAELERRQNGDAPAAPTAAP